MHRVDCPSSPSVAFQQPTKPRSRVPSCRASQVGVGVLRDNDLPFRWICRAIDPGSEPALLGFEDPAEVLAVGEQPIRVADQVGAAPRRPLVHQSLDRGRFAGTGFAMKED